MPRRMLPATLPATLPAILLLTLLLSPAARAAPTHYAGYQEVTGQKTLPVIGALTTRNRAWLLAERRPRADGGFDLVQRTCQVEFDRVMGVKIALSQALIAHLPAVIASLSPLADGSLGGRWTHGWDRADLERDGQPGATILVDAPMCGGRLYVASQTTTKARFREHAGALEGRLAVAVDQQILGADSACLKAASEDEHLEQTGWIRLVPVPADATCASWSRADWPATKAP